MSAIAKPKVRLTLEEAKLVLLAKAAETSGDKKINWSKADSQAASLQSAHELGENQTPAKILVHRAENVLKEMSARGIKTQISTKNSIATLVALLCIPASFVLGALTDKFTATGSMVNLLSLPFFGIIVWNLVIYLLTVLASVGLVFGSRPLFNLPLRSILDKCVETSLYSSIMGGFKREFLKSWSLITLPIVKSSVTRILNLCAIAFACGLVTGLVVRGFDTSFMVGWESTWLAKDATTVKLILDSTYGLVPSVWGLAPMPDIVDVGYLQFGAERTAQDIADAAPWFIRMIVLIAVFVVLPRLLLVILGSIRIAQMKKNVSIDISDEYFSDILSQCAEDAVVGELVVISSNDNNQTRNEKIGRFGKSWSNTFDPEINCMQVDFANIDNDLPQVPDVLAIPGRPPLVLLWFEGGHTPEPDIHAALIEKAKAICAGKYPLAVLADMTDFAQRFDYLAGRVKERENSWTSFAKACKTPLFVCNFSGDRHLLSIRELRSWAASNRPATDKA